MFTRPTLGLAEIAWRWSFGAACWLLLTFAFLEYLRTLPVTSGDLLLLKTRQPVLVVQAIRNIFHGSAFRALATGLILAAALAIAWVVLSSTARSATIQTLLAYFRSRQNPPGNLTQKVWGIWPLCGLNFFRLAVTLAAALGILAAFVMGGLVSSHGNPAPAGAFLIFLTVFMLVWFSWSFMNWFLSLASVFVVVNGDDTFAAISSAVSLCRDRPGSVFAAGTWFGLAHIAAFVLGTSVVAFPMGFAGLLPAGVVLGGVLLVTLLYFAVADFLYIGRLAAYVAILEFPMDPVTNDFSSRHMPPISSQVAPSRAGVDQDELILSDVPATT